MNNTAPAAASPPGFAWQSIQGVIFDVDGTLYDPRGLRLRMVVLLVAHYLRRPWRRREVPILAAFRRERERLADSGGEQGPETLYGRVADRFGVDPALVRRVVQQWLMDRPMAHLRACRFAGVAEFIRALSAAGVKVGVFSDYPAREKLRALDLPALMCVTAEDAGVGRLKPDPKGLARMVEKLGLPVDRCLFIGDRDERDGLCARRLGMRYLLKQQQLSSHGFRCYLDLHAQWRAGRGV